MRFISTRVHGILDYLMGVLLIASPWLLNFDHGGAETYVPVILGASAIVYSLFTDYEFGVFRSLSMRSHLTLDLISGLFLAASPWIFNFDETVYLPHLVLGLAEVGASLMTRAEPDTAHHGNTPRHTGKIGHQPL